MKKLVLTGAAGRLGSHLREPLSALADTLVSTDIVDDIGKQLPNETYLRADLASFDQVREVLVDADVVVHFGANGDEAEFDQLLGSNFIGAYNVWEAAFQLGVSRIVYASSIHAVGMHSNKKMIGTDVAHRPDTFYGLSKCFGEDLARLYWDKRGLEAVCLRILSCAEVTSARALGTWLSYADLTQLVYKAIEAPTTGFCIVYGVSNNDRVPVDNSLASFLGYRPNDNAEEFAEAILANTSALDPADPAHRCVGGPFAAVPLGSSGRAQMNIIDKEKNVK